MVGAATLVVGAPPIPASRGGGGPKGVKLELREPPIETIHALRPPRAGFPYFAHADYFPFEPEAVAESPINAWWLADASFLAYGTAEFAEEAFRQSPLPGQGFQLDWLGSRDLNRGLVVSDDASLVVVFRGTRLDVHNLMDVAELVIINQSDLWIDSLFLPAVCRAGGRVHSGFLRAFAEVSGELDALLKVKSGGQRVWLAGHSLGGALATLAAAHLGRDAVQGVYTYGCPRVGDAKFTSVLPETSHFRFVHREDWVVRQPPEFLGYVHGGSMRPVRGAPPRSVWDNMKRGARGLNTALTATAKELHLKVGDLPFTVAGLADHMPIHYATHLWNSLLASRQGAE
jgi:triacylglycerol lipase